MNTDKKKTDIIVRKCKENCRAEYAKIWFVDSLGKIAKVDYCKNKHGKSLKWIIIKIFLYSEISWFKAIEICDLIVI